MSDMRRRTFIALLGGAVAPDCPSQSLLTRDSVRLLCFSTLVSDGLEFRTGPSPRSRHI
jgi:hypothetical protein